MNDITPFLEAAIRTATPLLIAAVGEALAERAGVINIGLEGCLVAGAFAAFLFGSVGAWAGYGSSILAGTLLGVVLVIFSVILRRDQIIVGTAITMLGLGVTGALFRARAGGATPLVETDAIVAIPWLADIPVIGSTLFAQPAIAYVAILMVPAAWWLLYRSHAGLAIRAIGDAPEAAVAAGVRVRVVQSMAVLTGAALGGLAGGALVLAQAGTFAEGMSAGRGFLAIAIVALGRWRPAGVLVASVVFGAAMALQFVVQSLGWQLRYELVLMIPYVLTLAALGAFGRGAAPIMLGRSDAPH
ncbi:MAG TPA: ABC transporter permease [Gemmatimonadaceae bacterium]|nr:ABC transporter permease [Gemmatimonadaceae bacterium]